MELSEEKLEWRTIKNVFRKYRENAAILKRLDSSQQEDNYQLGINFSTASPTVVSDSVLVRQDAKAYNDAVMSCVNRLSTAERKIIVLSYLSEDRIPPWRIYEQELHIGRTLFYTSKAKAIGKLYVLFCTHGISAK